MRKTEKKVKVVPTQEELEKVTLDYLKSASKHMFMYKDSYWDKKYEEGVYFKLIVVEIEGKSYYANISINKGKIKIGRLKSVPTIRTKNHLGMFKNEVFRQWHDHKAVKQSKKLREVFDDIEKFIEDASSNGMALEQLNEVVTIKEFDI